MINQDAFNEILAQLKHDKRATNRLSTAATTKAYYEISDSVRDDTGSALRDRLATIPQSDLAAIRACIKALRNVYHC